MGIGSFVKKAAGGIGSFLGGKAGPGNPYGAPDLSFLRDSKAFDFLRDGSKFNFIKDSSQYDFLRDGSLSSKLPSQATTFAELYKPGARASDSMFNDLLTQIGAPSSVDQVQGEVDSDLMKNLLAGIDDDTKSAAGALKMDFADRGLSGAGQSSDIEGAGLGKTYADGVNTKAKVRSEFATKALDRLKAKETAARDAYTSRYAAGVGADTQDRQIAAGGAGMDAGFMNELLKSGAAMDQQGDMTFADLLMKGNASWADLIGGRDSELANILNQRDLTYAGQSLAAYNAGADRKIAGYRPGVADYFGKAFGTKLGESAGGGGADLFKAMLMGG